MIVVAMLGKMSSAIVPVGPGFQGNVQDERAEKAGKCDG